MDPFSLPGLQDGRPSGGKQRRRSGPRRKTGCHTCKARHASCDEKKPVCTNCERLNLHCQPSEFIVRSAWCPTTGAVEEKPTAEPSDAIYDGNLAASSMPVTSRESTSFETSAAMVNDEPATSPSGTSVISSSPASTSSTLNAAKGVPRHLNAEVAHLLSVYTTGVATWMDVLDHNRSYQYEVPRRCLTSELLTRCVCAFTAKQLSLVAPSGAIWSVPAARYYGDALRLLIQHLDSAPGSAPGDALTANMLLASYEMLEDHSYEHQRHLRGALTLIRMQGINAKSQGMDRANFWIYVRHDITIALGNESPLQLSSKDWNADWKDGETDEDALTNKLMWLVARTLDCIHASDHASPPDSILQDIYSEAVSWLNNLPASFHGVTYGQVDSLGLSKAYFAVPTAAAAMMWYHLLIILLCANTPSQDSSSAPQIQYHASEIANIALSDLPNSVRAFSAQPLLIAAKHINGIARKTKLWGLLDDLEIRCGLNSRRRIQKLQDLAESSV